VLGIHFKEYLLRTPKNLKYKNTFKLFKIHMIKFRQQSIFTIMSWHGTQMMNVGRNHIRVFSVLLIRGNYFLDPLI